MHSKNRTKDEKHVQISEIPPFIFYTRMTADAGNKRYVAGHDEPHQLELSVASPALMYAPLAREL